jgi:3-hydroxyisobutyrate dehydrogenase
MVDLMLKDLNLAMDAAGKAGVPVEMGALAQRLYTEHQAKGHGKRDFSSIMERFK